MSLDYNNKTALLNNAQGSAVNNNAIARISDIKLALLLLDGKAKRAQAEPLLEEIQNFSQLDQDIKIALNIGGNGFVEQAEITDDVATKISWDALDLYDSLSYDERKQFTNLVLVPILREAAPRDMQKLGTITYSNVMEYIQSRGYSIKVVRKKGALGGVEFNLSALAMIAAARNAMVQHLALFDQFLAGLDVEKDLPGIKNGELLRSFIRSASWTQKLVVIAAFLAAYPQTSLTAEIDKARAAAAKTDRNIYAALPSSLHVFLSNTMAAVALNADPKFEAIELLDSVAQRAVRVSTTKDDFTQKYDDSYGFIQDAAAAIPTGGKVVLAGGPAPKKKTTKPPATSGGGGGAATTPTSTPGTTGGGAGGINIHTNLKTASDAIAENKKLEEQVKVLKQDAEDLKREIRDLKAVIKEREADLESESDLHDNDNAIHKKEVATLKADLKRLQEELRQALSTNILAGGALGQKEKDLLAQLQQLRDDKQKEAESASKLAAALEKQIEDVETKNKTISKQKADAERDANESAEKVKELSKELTAAKAEIKQLNKSLKEADAKIAEITKTSESQLEQATKKLEDEKKKKATGSARERELDSELLEKKKEIATLKKQLEQSAAESALNKGLEQLLSEQNLLNTPVSPPPATNPPPPATQPEEPEPEPEQQPEPEQIPEPEPEPAPKPKKQSKKKEAAPEPAPAPTPEPAPAAKSASVLSTEESSPVLISTVKPLKKNVTLNLTPPTADIVADSFTADELRNVLSSAVKGDKLSTQKLTRAVLKAIFRNLRIDGLKKLVRYDGDTEKLPEVDSNIISGKKFHEIFGAKFKGTAKYPDIIKPAAYDAVLSTVMILLDIFNNFANYTNAQMTAAEVRKKFLEDYREIIVNSDFITFSNLLRNQFLDTADFTEANLLYLVRALVTAFIPGTYLASNTKKYGKWIEGLTEHIKTLGVSLPDAEKIARLDNRDHYFVKLAIENSNTAAPNALIQALFEYGPKSSLYEYPTAPGSQDSVPSVTMALAEYSGIIKTIVLLGLFSRPIQFHLVEGSQEEPEKADAAALSYIATNLGWPSLKLGEVLKLHSIVTTALSKDPVWKLQKDDVGEIENPFDAAVGAPKISAITRSHLVTGHPLYSNPNFADEAAMKAYSNKCGERIKVLMSLSPNDRTTLITTAHKQAVDPLLEYREMRANWETAANYGSPMFRTTGEKFVNIFNTLGIHHVDETKSIVGGPVGAQAITSVVESTPATTISQPIAASAKQAPATNSAQFHASAKEDPILTLMLQ